MFRLLTRPHLVLSAAIAIACCGSASHAAGALQRVPSGPQQVAGISAAPALGAVSNPRPYRRTRIVNCNTMLLGNPLGCLMAFGKVPAGQLLQIDNINCAGLAGAFLERAILFNTNLMLDEHLVAAFTSSSASTGHIVIASGPFYFKEGEVPRLTAAGHFSGDQAYCSVAGTLWQVN